MRKIIERSDGAAMAGESITNKNRTKNINHETNIYAGPERRDPDNQKQPQCAQRIETILGCMKKSSTVFSVLMGVIMTTQVITIIMFVILSQRQSGLQSSLKPMLEEIIHKHELRTRINDRGAG